MSSRIGKQPISVPDNVIFSVNGNNININGPKGERKFVLNNALSCNYDESIKVVNVKIRDENCNNVSALYGLNRNLLNNIVIGVSLGHTKKLKLVGVGYNAVVKENTLLLTLGYSHDILYAIPNGIIMEYDKKSTVLSISGVDKDIVGQIAAEIRAFRKPEPYKGKGVRYLDEVVLMKEGKKK